MILLSIDHVDHYFARCKLNVYTITHTKEKASIPRQVDTFRKIGHKAMKIKRVSKI